MIEQFGKDSERSDTGRSAANVALMNSVLRGMNPIPPILPLVGYGLYANSNFYTKEVLNDLKSKGFNVISANLSVSASSGSTNEGITIIVVNTENVRESLKNCKEIGVRCIVGIGSIAPNQISLLWSATVAAADDDKLCPIWRFTYPLSVSYMVSAAERCARIIERDGWERPVLLEMLSAGSSIDSLGGSLDKGWTDDNKFENIVKNYLISVLQ